YSNVWTIILSNTTQFTNKSLKAQVLGEYGWLLYQCGGSPREGERMVLDALALEPTNANLNVKAGLMRAAKYTISPHSNRNMEAIAQAEAYFSAALKADTNYAYVYWALAQTFPAFYTNTSLPDPRISEYQRTFIALSDRPDLELFLYGR